MKERGIDDGVQAIEVAVCRVLCAAKGCAVKGARAEKARKAVGGEERRIDDGVRWKTLGHREHVRIA